MNSIYKYVLFFTLSTLSASCFSSSLKEQKEFLTSIVNLVDKAARGNGELSSVFSVICPKNSFEGTIVLNHVNYSVSDNISGTLLIKKPSSNYNGKLSVLVPEVADEDNFFSNENSEAIGETFTFSMPRGNIYVSIWKNGKVTVTSQITGEKESPEVICKIATGD